jgi:CDP-glycerol glycerophosphotransferase
VVRTAGELYEALSDLDRLQGHRARLKEFMTRYGEYDQGEAAARIVDRFFGGRGGAR